jgi:hypothetical protein
VRRIARAQAQAVYEQKECAGRSRHGS